MDQTSVQGHIQSLQDAPKLRSMYFEYDAHRWRWHYPHSLPEHFRPPARLTSLVLAPARFDDFSAQRLAAGMLRTGLESLTFQMPDGALWSHLLVTPGLRRLTRLVAVDSMLDLKFLGRLSILHATCLDVTRMNPEFAQMPHLVSSPIRNNILISLRLGRADAGTLEDLFKWSPMLQSLEIQHLLSVPSVLLVPCPLMSLRICQAMPAATNISVVSPHPSPSTILPEGAQLVWTLQNSVYDGPCGQMPGMLQHPAHRLGGRRHH